MQQQLSVEEQKIAERAELEVSVRSVAVITTQEQADTIAGKLEAIITWRKWWTEHNEEPKKKAWEAHKAVCAAFNKLDQPAEADETHCRGLLGKWITEQTRLAELERQKLIEAEKQKQIEEAEAAAMEAEAQGATIEEVQAIFEQAEAAPMVAIAPAPARQSFVSSAFTPRDNWEPVLAAKSEVDAIKELCKSVATGGNHIACLQINWVVLRQLARAQKGTFQVPGFRAQNNTGIAKKAGR